MHIAYSHNEHQEQTLYSNPEQIYLPQQIQCLLSLQHFREKSLKRYSNKLESILIQEVLLH